MPLVSMKEMLITAKEQGYAVGQFNLNNLEFTQAILQAAKEENSPVILGVSEGAARYMGGFKTVVAMVEALIEDYDVQVPVAIHLDHGSSFESCAKAIQPEHLPYGCVNFANSAACIANVQHERNWLCHRRM